MQVLEEADYEKTLVESLEEIAEAECAQGQHGHAVQLYATATAWREATGSPRLLIYLRIFEQTTLKLRAALGDEAFAAAEASGRSLTLEQALADLGLQLAPRRVRTTDTIAPMSAP